MRNIGYLQNIETYEWFSDAKLFASAIWRDFKKKQKIFLNLRVTQKNVYGFDWRKKFFVCFNDLKRSEGELKKSSCRAPLDQNKNLAFRHDLFLSSTALVLLHLTLNLVSFSTRRAATGMRRKRDFNARKENGKRLACKNISPLTFDFCAVRAFEIQAFPEDNLPAETLINWSKLSLDGTARREMIKKEFLAPAITQVFSNRSRFQ